MSDRMTGVRPRAQVRVRSVVVGGTAMHGRHSRAEAIADYRAYYRWQLEEAQAALALTDDDLIVETYLGSLAQRDRQEVQS